MNSPPLYAQRTRLTILRDPTKSAPNPESLALAALGWVLSDDNHAERLLTLTGLTPDALRAGLGNRDILVAIMDFLMSHEPDLIAAADALGVEPQALVAAHHALAGPSTFDPEWSE